MSPTFSSLQYRNYRLFWSGMAVSNIGTWMQRVAQDWLVLHLAGGGPTALGITTALQFLPMLLVTPIGGMLADRVPKLVLLRCTQVASLATTLTLGVLTLTGNVVVWHVYLLAFCLGLVNAIDNPSRQSFVSEMVPLESLANAVSLNSASFQSARIVGPAVAGVLISLVGTGWVFILNGLTFLGPLVALYLIRQPAERKRRTSKGSGSIGEAVRYVRTRPDIKLVLFTLFFIGTFGFNFQITSALMATSVFHKGPGAYGLLASIMAVGSLTGSLLAARRGVASPTFVMIAGLAFGVLVTVSGLMPTYTTFALALVPMGAAGLTFMTSANAYVQTSVAPELRGRIMSLYLMVFMGGTPIGAPVIGWVGGHYGARWTVAGFGAVSLLGTVLALVLLGRKAGVSVRPASLRRGRRERLDAREQAADRLAETDAEDRVGAA